MFEVHYFVTWFCSFIKQCDEKKLFKSPSSCEFTKCICSCNYTSTEWISHLEVREYLAY